MFEQKALSLWLVGLLLLLPGQQFTAISTGAEPLPDADNRSLFPVEERVDIAPGKDNTLYEHASGALSNGAGQYLFVGRTGTGAIRRGLMAFDVAGNVPPGAEVVSATLTLYMSRTVVGAQPVELRRVLADWGEGASQAPGEEGGGAPSEPSDATWLHTFFDTTFWTTPGGDFSSVISAVTAVSDIGSYTWSSPQMRDDVQSWLDEPATNFGWLLLGNESTPTTTKRFNTRENSDAATRPVLSVIYRLPAEYGVELSPGMAETSGAPGETVIYALILTNTGTLTDTVDLEVTGNTWAVSLSDTSLVLGAGGSAEITAGVMIPVAATHGSSDVATVKATSVGDPNKSATSTLTTTAVAYRLFLPLVKQGD